MAKDIGIDLGSSTVLVYLKGRGIVLKEPSVVTIDKNTGEIHSVGRDAQRMIGRTPGHIAAVRPLRDGVISKYDVTQKMLQYFIKRACGNRLFFKPKVVICVPAGVTELEERALYDAAIQAGAKHVAFIEEPLAAAIGAGIDIYQPNGNMVINIGGGMTDVAVTSLGGLVVSRSAKVGGDSFDQAIINYIKQKYNILIGERTAEAIKMRIGTVIPTREQRVIDVKGRCLKQGMPKVVRVSSAEIPIALREPVGKIINTVRFVLERTDPELIKDILNNGIVMTGGGCLLSGLDKAIENATGIRTRVAENPVGCVAIGTGMALEIVPYLPEGTINISKQRLTKF